MFNLFKGSHAITIYLINTGLFSILSYPFIYFSVLFGLLVDTLLGILGFNKEYYE